MNHYKELFANGKNMWRKGCFQDAAQAYLRAAQSNVSINKKARAYELAGTMFFFSGDHVRQKINKLKAAEFWSKIADVASEPNKKICAYWKTFSQFAAIRDNNSQVKCISKIIDNVEDIRWKGIRWRILKKLLDKFPPAGSDESKQCLKGGLARIRVEQAQRERNFEKN